MHKTKLLSMLMAVAVLSVTVAASATANDENVRPVFNQYPDTTFVIDDEKNSEQRDEADFLRFGTRGQLGNGDDIEFCTDQTLDLWFYVHNGTSQLTNNSGSDWNPGDTANGAPFWNASNSTLDGPAVAHNTTVRLDVSTDPSNSHVVTASITSDESDDLSDTVQIACSDETKQINLVYDETKTTLSTHAPEHDSLGVFHLRGDLADGNGANLGYGQSGEGIVPGCNYFAAAIRGQLQIIVSDIAPVEDEETVPEETPEEAPEDAPEEIPRLGPAGAAPLAVVALSSALGAVGFRAVQSRR